MLSRLVSLLSLAAIAAPALAQPVNLTEKVAVGDCQAFSLEMELKGNLLVLQEGKQQPIRLEAKARHAFADRALAIKDDLATVSARYYTDAVASAVIEGERSNRTLPADRRLIVA